ncbi:MAG: 1,4-dihydroxy-6-naphthoate synthase [Ferruginibacter sp.]
MKKKISLGFSPCPNDTFIFDALVHGKIDTGNFLFEPQLEDVETLNQMAIKGGLDVTKLSYGVLPLVLRKYKVLDCGSALGRGVGPLFIKKASDKVAEINDTLIAIPGEHTTAHLLFRQAYPDAMQKIFLRYDEIESFVLEGKGYGVIIHENRFTYQEKGLEKIIDLGEFWEQESGFAIPLGGIVVSRKIDIKVQENINKLIRESIDYAFEKYPVLSDYVRVHAREMSEGVMRKHIDLYVNDFSLSLGEEGRAAIRKLMSVQPGNLKDLPEDIFV